MGSLVTSTPAKIIAVTEFPGRRAWSCYGGEVVELQENVILLRSTASTLADLDRHGTRHNVPGGQILGHRGIPLHEPLALAVDEVSALSSAPLGRPRRFQSGGTAQTPCPDWEDLKNYNYN